jgi:hypothetical protein
MMNIFSKMAVGVVGCMVAMTSVAPVYAAPISPLQLEIGSSVEQVQYKKKRPHRWDRRDNRRGDTWRAERRDWNGHRGYRDRRAGYRRNSDGWWYPLAAFGAGAIIGGAITSQPSYGSSHAQWCANRYRTYRAYDNTYVPYVGARARCVSPY